MSLPFELPAALQPITNNPQLLALVYLLIFLVLARLTDFFFVALLSRLAKRTTTELDDRSIALLHRPVFYSVLLIGIFVALQTLFGEGGQPAWMSMTLRTIGVLIWGTTLSRLVSSLLRIISHRTHAGLVQARTLPLFLNSSKILIFGGATYLLFLTWRIDISAWLASAGIIGIAVGFASRDTLANLISGVSIVADAPYKIGDYIVLDTGERGIVSSLGIRSTRLITRDDVEVSIPNAIIGTAKIINESGGPYVRHRIRLPIGVAYQSDIDKVIETLQDIAAQNETVVDEPASRVRIRGFGDNSINLELLCWIKRPADRGVVIHNLNHQLIKRFREEQISIPFPQRDLYVKSWADKNESAPAEEEPEEEPEEAKEEHRAE
jgi:MscS family membrane protein